VRNGDVATRKTESLQTSNGCFKVDGVDWEKPVSTVQLVLAYPMVVDEWGSGVGHRPAHHASDGECVFHEFENE
jgi:hypothetical protein